VEGKEIFNGNVDVAVYRRLYRECLPEIHRSRSETIDRENPRSESRAEVRLRWPVERSSVRRWAKVRKLLDPSEEGAAPLLGVNGLVFIGRRSLGRARQ